MDNFQSMLIALLYLHQLPFWKMQGHPVGPLHARPKLICVILFETLPEKLLLSLLLVGLWICGSVFWQMCFRPAFQIGESAVNSWSCVANCPSSPPLGLIVIIPERATESNYNFNAWCGICSMTTRWASVQITGMDKKGCLLLTSPCVSSALCVLILFPQPWQSLIPASHLESWDSCCAQLLLFSCISGHWILHFTSFFCLFLTVREGINWEAIDWMDNAECLDLIEKVSSYLWQFPGITAGTAGCLDLPWGFLVLKTGTCWDPLPIVTW